MLLILLAMLLILLAFFVCECNVQEHFSLNKKKHGGDYLIKIGSQKLMMDRFNEIFEIERTGYSNEFMNNMADLKVLRLWLLISLSEEMLLLQKADDMGISVTDKELDDALDEIKKDYPEGMFEHAFIENAISYPVWKNRLRVRLIIEKVINADLLNKIKLLPYDIKEYYNEFNIINPEPLLTEKGGNFSIETKISDNKMIVKYLLDKKAQISYNEWLEKIKSQYNVEINEIQW